MTIVRAEELFLRASAAPMNWLCPGSARSAALRIDTAGDAATLGTAAHEALALLAETNAAPWDQIPELAQKHGVHETELRVLVAQGVKLWNEVSDSFRGAMGEIQLATELAPSVLLTGHVDLLAVSGRTARAGDWKTGRKDGDYSQQMRAYALLLFRDDPDLVEVTVTVLWVRDGEIENYTATREQAERWAAEYVERVVEWNGVYRPGTHCGYCSRSHECEAANANGRRDVALIADRSLVHRVETELATMPDEEIVDLAARVEFVQHCAARVKDALTALVRERGDIVAGGHRLTLGSRETKELDTLRSWPVLEAAGFGDEELRKCVSISLSKANDIVAQRAGRGRGAAAVRELREQLDAADAVTVRTSTFLARKRA